MRLFFCGEVQRGFDAASLLAERQNDVKGVFDVKVSPARNLDSPQRGKEMLNATI